MESNRQKADTHLSGSTFAYEVGDGLYLNITNRCTCDCVFCVRHEHSSVGDADTLWLSREPSLEEALAALERWDVPSYRELVFCGFGEPTVRWELLLAIARQIKERYPETRIRINTNGHASLLHNRDVTPEMNGLIDALSISLNYPDAARYIEHCKPQFGEAAFTGLLDFAKRAKAYVPEVTLSVVDCLPPEDITRCERLAEQIGVHFRVRAFIN